MSNWAINDKGVHILQLTGGVKLEVDVVNDFSRILCFWAIVRYDPNESFNFGTRTLKYGFKEAYTRLDDEGQGVRAQLIEIAKRAAEDAWAALPKD